MTRTWLLVVSLLLGGCSLLGLSGLEVEAVGVSAQKPSNVAVYLWAAHDDRPLTELALGDFRIYENEQLLSAEEISLTLLDRTDAAEHHTLVLVDMSTDDEAQRLAIAKGVAAFVQKVRREQGVTVYAYDGYAKPALVGEFARGDAGEQPSSLARLEAFRTRDSSRDLNGAVVEGLKQLDARLMRAQKPLRVGTLLVFARGDDLAGRVSHDQLLTVLDETPHLVFGLGIGEADSDTLDSVAGAGVIRAHTMDTIAIGFEDAAAKVDPALKRHYLLSYCTPPRAGIRQLRVQVVSVDEEGQEVTGDVDLEFDAAGFGPGCDPRARPRFVAQAVTASGSDPGSAGTVGAASEPDPGEPADAEIAPPPAKPGYAPE